MTASGGWKVMLKEESKTDKKCKSSKKISIRASVTIDCAAKKHEGSRLLSHVGQTTVEMDDQCQWTETAYRKWRKFVKKGS